MSNFGTLTIQLAFENGQFVGRYSKVSNNGEMTSGILSESITGQLSVTLFPQQVASIGATIPATATTATPGTTAASATIAVSTTPTVDTSVVAPLIGSTVNLKVKL